MVFADRLPKLLGRFISHIKQGILLVEKPRSPYQLGEETQVEQYPSTSGWTLLEKLDIAKYHGAGAIALES